MHKIKSLHVQLSGLICLTVILLLSAFSEDKSMADIERQQNLHSKMAANKQHFTYTIENKSVGTYVLRIKNEHTSQTKIIVIE